MNIVATVPKGGYMIALIFCFIISCGTIKEGVKPTHNSMFTGALPSIPFHQYKADTPKIKQPSFDTKQIQSVLNRLPIAMDRLDKVSDRVDGVSLQLDYFIKSQAIKDSQFNIMFNVANSRRKQIANMKADSVQKEGQILAAIKRMSDAAENDRKYKSKIAIEERVDTNIVLFTCIATLVIGFLSNLDKLILFWNRIFKKKSYA